jgi:hypothetical protein
MKRFHAVAIWLVFMLAGMLWLGSAVIAQGDYDLSWWTVEGGGASSGGPYRLVGAAGQADAGVLSNGNFSLTGGFLAAGSEEALSNNNYLPSIERRP